MSLVRLFLAGLMVAVLGGLIGWQVHRERLVRACVEDGGLWHGARSASASGRSCSASTSAPEA